MYETIVVPTDGSEQAERAAEHAIELAGRYGANLHVLYVIDDRALGSTGSIGGYAGVTGADFSAIRSSFEEEGQNAVDAIAELAAEADVDCETAVVDGLPSEAILSYVEDADADLIVMGTHGRTGLERFMIGSVAERIVRGSSVPVLTVRSGE